MDFILNIFFLLTNKIRNGLKDFCVLLFSTFFYVIEIKCFLFITVSCYNDCCNPNIIPYFYYEISILKEYQILFYILFSNAFYLKCFTHKMNIYSFIFIFFIIFELFLNFKQHFLFF